MFDTLNSQLDLFTDYGAGKYFLGKVVANTDPLNIDRVQASVPGLYDPDLGDIPWIGPLKFSPFGIGATWGVYGVPAIGSDVLILLQDGDPHYPMYLSAQTVENPDFPSGTCWGFQDPYGNQLKVTAESIVFTSNDGVTFTISSGNLDIDLPGNITITASGNVTATAAEFNINGPTNINGATHITGNTNITGSLAVSAAANLNGGASVTGSMANNGVNIGSSHVHGGVVPGGGNTAVPH